MDDKAASAAICPRAGRAGRATLWAVVVVASAVGVRSAMAANACFINTNSPAGGVAVQGKLLGGTGCPPAQNPYNVSYAGTFNISIDGGPSTLSYCVDIKNPISPGQCVPQDPAPDLPCPAVYILNNYYPNAAPVLSPTSKEAAAVQAAIWRFTDCYEITGPADVKARADAIIADAIANGSSCTPPTAPQSITIDPSTALNIFPDDEHCATATVLDTLGAPVTNTAITVTITGTSGPQTINGTTDGAGQFSFCYQNPFLVAGSDTIRASVSFTVEVGLAFKAPGVQGIVLAGQPRPGSVEGTATKNWVHPQCGDGIVNQAAEECDDGNAIDGDGCDTNCTQTRCGNGIVTAPEECDDGNLINGDGCDANCTLPRCGNGEVVPPEECDDGNLDDGDGCDSNCRPTGCGNGIVTPPEECDDGNTVNGDGCDNNCTTSRCGNGQVDPLTEECDDGNLVDGDGCDSNCRLTACGNGIKDPSEECDDGNLVDGDGCDSNCTTSRCGNGIVTPPEECDDGNLLPGDACEPDCTTPRCGNGIVDVLLGEQCDDGNLIPGDGCEPDCRLREICTDLLENDGDGLIDCDDPDCNCQVFARDPTTIAFRTRPSLDRLRGHGRMVLANPNAMFTSPVGFLVTNVNGEVYRVVVPGSALQPFTGKGAKLSNPAARTSGGLAKVRIMPRRGYYQVRFLAYGDLTRATLPLMTIQVSLAGENAFYRAEWRRRPYGWQLQLPPPPR